MHAAPVRFLLVHSPVVGPATWRGVAAVLRRDGHDAAVPDLRDAAVTGDPAAVVAAAAAALTTGEEPVVVAGHSGAGFFLPLVAAAATAGVGRTIFVDAGIPPCHGSSTPSADFVDRLRELAVGGVLPRWSDWWGDDDAMAALVADADRRAQVEAELPRIPLALYESPVAMPAGWCDGPGAYLLLSDAYRDDAVRASALGWPVVERPGNHLDVVNRPGDVARDLLALAR